MLSEITQRKINTLLSHLYVKYKKKKKEKTKQNQTHTSRDQMGNCQDGGGGRWRNR